MSPPPMQMSLNVRSDDAWSERPRFKTVEAFCPTTCQCGRAVESSSCPLPFGISCDRLGDRFCLTLNGRHYCPGPHDEILARSEHGIMIPSKWLHWWKNMNLNQWIRAATIKCGCWKSEHEYWPWMVEWRAGCPGFFGICWSLAADGFTSYPRSSRWKPWDELSPPGCPGGLTPFRHATLFSKMATNDATIVDPLLPQIQAAHEEMYRTLVYMGGEKKTMVSRDVSIYFP